MTKPAEIKGVKSGPSSELSLPKNSKAPLTKKELKEPSSKESGDLFVSPAKGNSGNDISNAVYNPSQGSSGGALHRVQIGNRPSGEEIERTKRFMKLMHEAPERKAKQEHLEWAERQEIKPEVIREVKNSNMSQFEKDLILNILEPDYPKYEPDAK